MIAALITYPEWERAAAAAPEQFPLSPMATKEQCAVALGGLPEHPVKVHLFAPPMTFSYDASIEPLQLIAAVIGVMSQRYRGDSGFRVGRGRYLVHTGEKAKPADCYILELSTEDGNRATVALSAARRGGALYVSFASVCREPYGLIRWLGQWGFMASMGGMMAIPTSIGLGLLLSMFGGGIPPGLLCLLWPAGIFAVGGWFGYSVWHEGVVHKRDNKPMPTDGTSFVTLVTSTAERVLKSGTAAVLKEAGWSMENKPAVPPERPRGGPPPIPNQGPRTGPPPIPQSQPPRTGDSPPTFERD